MKMRRRLRSWLVGSRKSAWGKRLVGSEHIKFNSPVIMILLSPVLLALSKLSKRRLRKIEEGIFTVSRSITAPYQKSFPLIFYFNPYGL